MVASTTTKILGFVVMVVVADIVAIGIYYSLQPAPHTTPASDDVLSPPSPSDTVLGVFSRAAVVSEGGPCAGFGRDILAQGGNAVDAVITTLLCDGVCVMQSNGVGGGFVMTIYNSSEGKAYSLIARETAPGLATQDMYVNHSDWATIGPKAVGVPGELKGYQELHGKFGNLEWKTLFQPTIKLAQEGVPVNKRLAEHFAEEAAKIKNSDTFVKVILNSTGGRLPKEGDKIKLPLLAQTLSVIANSPKRADELYNGSLTKKFVDDIQAAGGIITEEDMNNYAVQWEKPYRANLSDGSTVYSAALPGSGILVTFMLRVLDGFLQFAYSDLQRSQLIIEAFKHAYGRRSDLGDYHKINPTIFEEVKKNLTDEAAILAVREKIKSNWTSNDVSYYGGHYLKDDHGTNNVVVVDQQGNAISVTSTLNLLFGSKFVSTSTGIILNDQMDDFSTPGIKNSYNIAPSENNFIAPGKRPLSSMSPTIVVDSGGDVKLAVGGAGGSKITTQVTLVTIRNLWLGKNLKEAIDEPRFHHQLLPMNVTYEYGVLKEVVDGWHNIGHSTNRLSKSGFLAIVNGVARLGANLTANCDWRKPGSLAGL
ncbi:scoloptoxin SSD14-like [Homalodisca vitripennis]|uniref:scoloptoxin SSD14-like n=1 Tax=Homalodisca vitripennis TaxID=197043 RepID=UPI001EECB551|nr:scoloptoxin SSD14-like [Homalodisca vitripennis]XP_046674036.1 scoloptoxin SSD14-like [Homalodisca vitripennis]